MAEQVPAAARMFLSKLKAKVNEINIPSPLSNGGAAGGGSAQQQQPHQQSSSSSTPVRRAGGGGGGGVPVMTMSLDDLGGGGGGASPATKQAEEPLWLEMETSKLHEGVGLDWKLTDLDVRKTALECVLLATDLEAAVPTIKNGEATLNMLCKGLGISQRGRKRLLKEVTPVGNRVPVTSAQSDVDVHAIRTASSQRALAAAAGGEGTPDSSLDVDDTDTLQSSASSVSGMLHSSNGVDGENGENEEGDGPRKRPSKTVSRPKSVYAFVQYQMLLLMMKRVEHFDDPKMFQEWHERRAQVLLYAVMGHVAKATTSIRNWQVEGKALTSKQIQARLTQAVDSLCNDFVRKQWWRSCEEEYVVALKQLQQLVLSIAEQVATTCVSLKDGGEALPFAFPANVVLYERLMWCAFNQQDGQVNQHDLSNVLELLKHLRDSLGISSGMHSICHARLLYHAYQLVPTKDRFALVQQVLPQVLAAAGQDMDVYDCAVSCEIEYGGSLLDQITDHFYNRLCKFLTLFEDDPHMLVEELGIFMAMRDTKAKRVAGKCLSQEQKQQEVEAIIESAVKFWYERLMDDYILPLGLPQAMDVTDTINKQVDVVHARFTPGLLPFHSSPTSTCLRGIIRCFQPHVTDALNEIPVLNKESAALLQRLQVLEEHVHEYDIETTKHEFDLVVLCRRLVSRWVADQRTNFKPFLEMVARGGVWTPCKPPSEVHAKTAADLFDMFNSSLNAFLEMAIPHSEAFIKPLIKGMTDSVEEYCRIACVDMDRTPQPRQPPCISNRKEKESLVEILLPEEEQIYDKHRMGVVCVRLNSVDYCKVSLEALKARLLDLNPQAPVQGIDQCVGACKQASSEIRKFAAARTIYYDLQGPLLKGLYVPTVEDSRMQNVLGSFQETLGTLYQMVCANEQQAMITDVYVAFLAGFEFVLMQGGIKRVFKHEHTKVFQQDLQVLQEFFQEALPAKVVTTCSRHLDELLRELFAKSSKELTEEYAKAKDSDPRLIMTKYNIFRVLRHRTKMDGLAKKFIRKFKISKDSREFIKNLKQS